MKIGLAGYLRVHTTGPEGEITNDSGWFPNLITDQGLDWFGMGPPNDNIPFGVPAIATHAAVGIGTTPPAFSDTQLSNFVAMFPATTDGGVVSAARAYVAGPPAYWSWSKTFNFPQGAVVANIAEVGVGNTSSTDTQPQLFNHALILDGSGNPTTIPVISTDSLTITFQLRMYLDLTDNSYAMQINATNYTGTYRRATVNQVPSVDFATISTASCGMILFSGALGSVTSSPSGQLSGGSIPMSSPAYIPGTYFKNLTATFSPGNGTGTIAAIESDGGLSGSYQFSLSPTLVK